MKRADRLSGIFWFLLSVFVSVESYCLGLGTVHEPGPGFICFWTGMAMAVMSIAVLVRAWTPLDPFVSEGPLFERKNLLKITFVVLALFLYASFMEVLGFIPVTLLLFLFLLRLIEKKKWAMTVLVTVIVTGMSYVVFEVWLKAQLPRGLMALLRF